MLVLSRKCDEKILIHVPGFKEIEVTVVQIDSSRIRLGFDAPKDVIILRKELQENKLSNREVISYDKG